MTTVLFACVHNAGRSQMAAAFFNALADRARFIGISAGTDPGDRVHPEVVAAMKEVGLDVSSVRPKRLTAEMVAGVGFLVTTGCGEACPSIPAERRVDWPVADPKGARLERVRAIRDEIRDRVVRLVAERVWGP